MLGVTRHTGGKLGPIAWAVLGVGRRLYSRSSAPNMKFSSQKMSWSEARHAHVVNIFFKECESPIRTQ